VTFKSAPGRFFLAHSINNYKGYYMIQRSPQFFWEALNIGTPYTQMALKPLWFVSFRLPDILNIGTGDDGRLGAEVDIGEYTILNEKRALLGDLDNNGAAFGPTDAWDGTEPDRINYIRTTDSKWIYNNGNMFVSDVIVPGDSYLVSRKKIDNYGRGEVAGLIGGGRGDFEPLSIKFFETNSSFVETVIRPWLIYTAHNGLKIQSVKTNIYVVLLGFNINEINNPTEYYIRKSYTFHGAFPQTVGTESYDHIDGLMVRDVQFGYNWYSTQGWYEGGE